MAKLAESHVEEAALEWLGELGWQVAYGVEVTPDGDAPIRAAYSDVILIDRLREAIARLNPNVPPDAREEALRRVLASETPSLVEENRRLHRFLIEGVPIEFHDGERIRGDRVRLIELAFAAGFDRNDWLA